MDAVLWHPLTSMLFGAFVTWLAARYYFKKAGDELRAEAAALHKATAAIIYCLEHPDAKVEAQRDAQGRITGLIVNMTAHGVMAFSARADLTAAPPSD